MTQQLKEILNDLVSDQRSLALVPRREAVKVAGYVACDIARAMFHGSDANPIHCSGTQVPVYSAILPFFMDALSKAQWNPPPLEDFIFVQNTLVPYIALMISK